MRCACGALVRAGLQGIHAAIFFSARPARLSFVLAALGCASAQASDSSFGDDNRTIGLLHQPDVNMDKEALLLSDERVQVDYVLELLFVRGVE
nr:DUF4424 family protein [Xanthomonas arboricola]